MKIKQLVLNAMLAAMCAALGYVALDFINLKVTFESLPILIAGFLFGPADGLMVGAVGTFIYQVLRYGFSVTTFLWMLPYLFCGYLAGAWARYYDYRPKAGDTLAVVILCEVCVTLMNTAVMYIDSKIYGYYSFAYIFGTALLRFVICVGKAVVFGLVLPPLLSVLRKVNRNQS